MSRLHQVYFLQRADGLIKIGTSHDFPSRLSQLTASHGMLGIIRVINGDRKLERQLHVKFKRFHEYGEWFRDQRGELSALIAALPEGDQQPFAHTDGEWSGGEAAFMVQVRQKIADLLVTRMQRTGLKAEAALRAVTKDYGFKRYYLQHLRGGRASTISAYGWSRLCEAHVTEMQIALDYYRGEIVRMRSEADDAELLRFAQELDRIEAELESRIAAKKAGMRLARTTD